MHDRPFPPVRAPCQPEPVSEHASDTRVADTRLRGAGGLLSARTYWPGRSDRRPALMVFFAPDEGIEAADGLCRTLCTGAGLVVLSASYGCGLPDATRVIGWAADHGTDLGADPARLVVAGDGTGGGIAAAIALQARDEDWPPLARQVLVHPVLPAGDDSLVGLPPATVVTRSADGIRYAARLRLAGVPVDRPPYDELASSLRQNIR